MLIGYIFEEADWFKIHEPWRMLILIIWESWLVQDSRTVTNANWSRSSKSVCVVKKSLTEMLPASYYYKIQYTPIKFISLCSFMGSDDFDGLQNFTGREIRQTMLSRPVKLDKQCMLSRPVKKNKQKSFVLRKSQIGIDIPPPTDLHSWCSKPPTISSNRVLSVSIDV